MKLKFKEKDRKKEAEREEDIIRALPTFINQLLLLLSSGMVLQEALATIAVRYGSEKTEKVSYFRLSVYELYLGCEKNGQDFLQAFCDFSRGTRVRELTRLARILMDGRRRGSDLWDKLAEEGESLWAERRRRAGEKIRLAESKMSFPLALMMIALIIITAAPAMLQMYI